MDKTKEKILADDLAEIRQLLRESANYAFAADIAARMQALCLSQSALAARVGVQPATVAKWLKKEGKPHGKETLKRLGMALAMDEEQLNVFLRANGYPGLYVRNPLDDTCRRVLSVCAGEAGVVQVYDDYIRIYGLRDQYTLNRNPSPIDSAVFSREFHNIQSSGSFGAWLKENETYFRAFDKTYIPHMQLVQFIRLYMNGESINNKYVAASLPVTIKNLLYDLQKYAEVAVKALRAKLIVYGLYENMTEEEIDIMLEIAKFGPLKESAVRMDCVILTALGCAHNRYPYYERDTAKKVLKLLDIQEYPELFYFYAEKKEIADKMVVHYEKNKDESDRIFETVYSSYAGCGILDYMRDILAFLAEDGTLSEKEAKEYTSLMRTF